MGVERVRGSWGPLTVVVVMIVLDDMVVVEGFWRMLLWRRCERMVLTDKAFLS